MLLLPHDLRCSRIGINVLREGGNAVDASVAAVLRLGVVNPASSGLGGGAFMFIRLASGEAHAFDMRETAPLLASENMYAGNETLKGKGALSVAIPGELISPYLHMQMVKMISGILADEGLRHPFTLNGSLLKTGETCCNMKLAETLSQISKFGPIAFYNGSIGSKLVRDIQKLGGIRTMKDLQNYKVKLRKPVSADTLGLKILTMPPPSGGPPMILVSKALFLI
nr:glutathione hydrolase 2-like [Malus domestica]